MNNIMLAIKKGIRHIITLSAIADYISFFFREQGLFEMIFVLAVFIIIYLRSIKYNS